MPLLLVVLPTLTAVACVALGVRRRREVRAVAVGGTALTTLVALFQWFSIEGNEALERVYATVPTGGPPLSVMTHVDSPARTVALLVCVVALLVQIYSTAYLAPHGGDSAHPHRNPGRRYPSYAALVSLFTAAMLLVVVAGDLLVLFVGWEVMGLCSYFLISYDWEDRPARAAAVKAFLVTRVGDVALLFGIFVLGTAVGSFRISEVLAQAPALPPATALAASLLLIAGILGKSAQFPLHIWLPDAMAGPTPVSALIHAATMVASGVYLGALMFPVLRQAPVALAVLGVIAAVTMVGAALAALAQDDLKRVLAWSTVSQLAIMLGAIAVGAPRQGLFHLLTHGAFKALLFLAAGAVLYATGTALLAELGGLARRMPLVAGATVLGLAALAGVPPLSGFFSKDAVLHAALEAATPDALGVPEPGLIVFGDPRVPAGYSWVGWLIVGAVLLTVALTAAYATRVGLLLFAGSARTPAVASPGTVPPEMSWPLIALMVPTVLLGLLGLDGAALPLWLRRPHGAGFEGAPGWAPTGWTWWAALIALVLGVLVVYVAWLRAGAVRMKAPADLEGRDPARVLAGLRPPAARGFGVDAAADAAVVRPTWAAAHLVRALDDEVVDAYVRGAGRGSRLLSTGLGYLHTGNVQTYLTVLLAGAIGLAVWVAS